MPVPDSDCAPARSRQQVRSVAAYQLVASTAKYSFNQPLRSQGD